MNTNSDRAAGLIVVIVCVLFVAGVLMLSKKIGADFQITLGATLRSIPVLIFSGAAIWFLKSRILAGFAATAAVLWPFWWGVVDSIAVGGQNPDTAIMLEQPWWDTGWVLWGTELSLVSLAIWLIVRSLDLN